METEKITIIELDIKQDDVVKKLADITAQMKLLKEQEGLTAEQQEINKAQLKALSQEYQANQKVLVNLTQSETAELGTLQKLALSNKTLRAEQQKLNLETKEGQKRNIEINKEINKNTDTIKKHSDALVQDKMNVGNYKSALEGLPGPFGGVIASIKSMTKAAIAFIATPFGAIMAGIAAVIGVLVAAFKNSQPLMDKFHQAGDAIAAVWKVVIDRISNFVEKVVKAFDNPGQAIKDFGQLIVNQIVNRFKALPEIAINSFKAVKEAIKGNFDEAKQAAIEAGKAMTMAVTGVDPDKLIASIKSITAEIKEETKQAALLAKQQQELEDLEIRMMKTRAILARDAKQARLDSEAENLSTEERIKFIDIAIEKQKALSAIEIQIAKERARISQEQVDMGNSTREELKANEELQIRAIEIEKEQATLLLAFASKRKSLIEKAHNDEIAAEKKKVDALIAEQKRYAEFMIQSLDEEVQRQIESDEAMDAYNQNRLLINAQNKREVLESSLQNEFELKQAQLNADRQAELDAAEKTGADVTLINQKYANYQKILDEEGFKGRMQIAAGFADAIAGLFGEQTKIAKIAAIAKATINAFVAMSDVFAAEPGELITKTIAAAIALGQGIAIVAKIRNVKSGLPGDSGGGGGSISAPSASTAYTKPSAAQLSFAGSDVLQSRSVSGSNMELSMINALKKVPMQPVLVTDKVTWKQNEGRIVNDVATV